MPRLPLRLFRLPTTRAKRRRRMYTMLFLVFVMVAFVLPFYVIYKPPNALIRYFQRRWPDVLWHVPLAKTTGGEKVIALTIDDAPSEYTREILQVLEEYDAHATFFVIGGQVS